MLWIIIINEKGIFFIIKLWHLNGTILHVSGDLLSRPTLLITDSLNATTGQPSRKQRDAFLINTITETLKGSGNVLIPIDAASRMLELVYLLEQLWLFHKIPFTIVLLTYQGAKTIGMAKNMLEWMGEAASQAFSQKKESPFDFK
jgi:cleavage and polyadenylation specificity factor subunit 2